MSRTSTLVAEQSRSAVVLFSPQQPIHNIYMLSSLIFWWYLINCFSLCQNFRKLKVLTKVRFFADYCKGDSGFFSIFFFVSDIPHFDFAHFTNTAYLSSPPASVIVTYRSSSGKCHSPMMQLCCACNVADEKAKRRLRKNVVGFIVGFVVCFYLFFLNSPIKLSLLFSLSLFWRTFPFGRMHI